MYTQEQGSIYVFLPGGPGPGVVGVSEDVEVGFLPAGNTHEDIDQEFSRTSTRPRSKAAITLDDFHDVLRNKFPGSAVVVHMNRIANCSGLRGFTKALKKFKSFSQYK